MEFFKASYGVFNGLATTNYRGAQLEILWVGLGSLSFMGWGGFLGYVGLRPAGTATHVSGDDDADVCCVVCIFGISYTVDVRRIG